MTIQSKITHQHVCPATYGYAFEVRKGQMFRLTDLEGQQPIDFWGFCKAGVNEHLSVCHTRVWNLSMVVRPGQVAVTNKRRPIVTLIEDNSPGQHDMLLAACDPTRFETLGHKGYHRNCQDNMHEALAALDVKLPFSPQPWNLFTHFPWTSDMRIELQSPDTKPGDNIVFRAEMDAIFGAGRGVRLAPGACPCSRWCDSVLINSERLWSSLMEMAEIGKIPGGGCRRLSLTPEDRAGRDLFFRWCCEAGCRLEVDSFGNIFAIRAGRAEPGRLVMTGSHLDTQPIGGRFDGIYGVLAGLEVLRTLNDLELETDCSVAVVNWTNEEGARFSAAQTGSKGFAGQVSRDEAYRLRAADGTIFGEALTQIGYAGHGGVRAEHLVCYVEAHIEQGPVLEASGKTIGIVVSAQAARWYHMSVTGEARHAGTTPAARRRDAFMAACSFAVESRRRLLAMNPDIRFTIGRVELGTNAPNTVPGQANLTIDLRFPDEHVLDRAEAALRDILSDIDRQEGTHSDLQVTHLTPAVRFDEDLTRDIEALAGNKGMRLSSGAMHDACAIATVAPTAMIFVPSRDGISHHHDEWLEPRDAADGAARLSKPRRSASFQIGE